MEEERDAALQQASVKRQATVPTRVLRREEFVPQCDEEMEEWMAGRHADFHTAMVAGQLRGGQNFSVNDPCGAPVDPRTDELSFSGGEHSEVIAHQCGGAHGALSGACERNSRYGLRGVKIGEASNPGPSKRSAGRDTVVHARQRSSDPGHLTLIDSSDEDTPFVVPRPSRRLALVPESADVTPQSIQDRERDTRLESGAQFSMMDRGYTLVSSDEEPLVPCSRNSVVYTGSTVPASTGALLHAGVEESQFVRDVAARVEERSRDIDPSQWESDAEFSLGSRPVEFQSQSQPDSATCPRRREAVSAGGGFVTFHNRLVCPDPKNSR